MLPVHRPILRLRANKPSPQVLSDRAVSWLWDLPLPFQNCSRAFFLSASFSFYFGSGLLKCFKLTSRFVLTEAFWFSFTVLFLYFHLCACQAASVFPGSFSCQSAPSDPDLYRIPTSITAVLSNQLSPVLPFQWLLPLIESRCLVNLP